LLSKRGVLYKLMYGNYSSSLVLAVSSIAAKYQCIRDFKASIYSKIRCFP